MLALAYERKTLNGTLRNHGKEGEQEMTPLRFRKEDEALLFFVPFL